MKKYLFLITILFSGIIVQAQDTICQAYFQKSDSVFKITYYDGEKQNTELEWSDFSGDDLDTVQTFLTMIENKSDSVLIYVACQDDYRCNLCQKRIVYKFSGDDKSRKLYYTAFHSQPVMTEDERNKYDAYIRTVKRNI